MNNTIIVQGRTLLRPQRRVRYGKKRKTKTNKIKKRSQSPGLAARTWRRSRWTFRLSTLLARRIPRTIFNMVMAKAVLALVCETARGKRCNTLAPIPGSANNGWWCHSTRLTWVGYGTMATYWGSSGMKVKQLNVKGWPICQVSCSCMLSKEPIIRRLYPADTLAIGPQNEQLIKLEILPSLGKLRCKHEAIHRKCLQPAANIYNLPLWFLGRGHEDQPPSKNNWGSESDCVWMCEESNSLSSTNLPDTIWLTSFGGTGEKPGATINDCCKTGTFCKEENTVGRNPLRHSKAKERQKVMAAKKLRQRMVQQSFTLHLVSRSGDRSQNWWKAHARNCQGRCLGLLGNAPSRAGTCLHTHCRACCSLFSCERLFKHRDHQGQKGRGWHVRLPASLMQRTISIAAGRAKNFGVGTRRRRQLFGRAWRRTGIQTGCKAIVGTS